MNTLGARHGIESKPGQTDAPAGVLDSGPRQRRVEVIAPVHEYRSGVNLVDQTCERGFVSRPDARRQAVCRVVNQSQGFVVALDLSYGGSEQSQSH